MGRELQKKKNRSGIQKVRQKPKSKKTQLLHHPLIAANWDKSQTLSQNYRRLGLASKLNKHTGGVEKKAADLEREAEEDADEAGFRRRKDDALSIASSKRPEKLDLGEAKIERDPVTGNILRVVGGEEARPNPLNDPLNEVDSDSDAEDISWATLANQGGKGGMRGRPTGVVEDLESLSSKPAAKYKRKQTDAEKEFIVALVKKYGEDYRAMARDIKVNYMQRSESDLKKRVKVWRENGGRVG